MNTARGVLAGAGTQTAALAAGGGIFPPVSPSSASESFNGSTWTTTSSMNTSRQTQQQLMGTQTSAIVSGGNAVPGVQNITESWNGTSWTSSPPVANIITARAFGESAGNATNALLIGGGNTLLSTEIWTDPSFAVQKITTS